MSQKSEGSIGIIEYFLMLYDIHISMKNFKDENIIKISRKAEETVKPPNKDGKDSHFFDIKNICESKIIQK